MAADDQAQPIRPTAEQPAEPSKAAHQPSSDSTSANPPPVERRITRGTTLTFDDTTIIGGCRRAVLRSFSKIPADWDSNVFVTIFNYVRYGHLHTLRSMQPLLHPIASQDERRQLYGAYGIRSTGTLNLLTWRRSALYACFWIALGSAMLLAAVARESQDNLYRVQQQAVMPTNGTALRGCRYEEQDALIVSFKTGDGNTTNVAFERDPVRTCDMDFPEYQQEILLIALARTTLPAKQVDSVLDLILAFFSWAALIPTLMALARWHRYGLSIRLVGLAWILTFLTPFIISIVPVRIFVDWDAMDTVLNDYLVEFRTHFQTAEKEQMMYELCDLVIEYEGNHPYNLVDNVCSIVEQMPRRIEVAGYEEFNADLSELHKQCGNAREVIASGTDQQLIGQAKAMCTALQPYLSGEEGGRGSTELYLAVQEMVERMKDSIELGIGLSHAMMSFQIMVPAAISLAPGLIRGAMRAKTLVPQSSIPGMFILMLPWLYCPLVWCMYNIVFQLLGNLIMLMGLLLLAYGPMTYFVLGLHFNVTKPMTDHKMRQVLTWMNYYIIMYTSVAYLCIVYWLFFTDARKLIEEAIKEFKNPQLALSILFSILSKYLYTTLLGVDCMVNEIASQRRWETYLTTGVMPFATTQASYMSEDAREGVKKLMQERTVRLDELVKVVNDK